MLPGINRIEADLEARVRQAFDRMVIETLERESATRLARLGGTESQLESARRRETVG